MAIAELLVLAGMMAGLVKFQIDLAQKTDTRMDNLEKQLILLYQSMELMEGRINLLFTSQTAFMEQVEFLIRRKE